MSNPGRPQSNDSPDLIDRRLREAFLAEQGEVEGSRDFARRIREQLVAEVGDSAPPAFRGRRRVAALAALFAVAACLLLLVRLGGWGQTDGGENRAVADRNDAKLADAQPHQPVMTAEDAEEAVEFVNLGLGQTVRSVGVFRTSVSKFLQPLQLVQEPSEVDKPEPRVPKVFDMKDDQLVAKITWQVLGLRP